METTLLHTKLHPPWVDRRLVERPSLIIQLNQRLNRKLTLVSAPAGYGKSTLVVQWLEQVDRPFAWVSLSETDNDPSHFLNYFLAAVRTCFPEACGASLQLLQSPDLPDSSTLADTLSNDLFECSESFLLVLDDYQTVHNIQVNQLLNALVDRCPPNFHLVIISRVDPPLPLPQLRASGQFLEMRSDSLRFADDEAQRFLQLKGVTEIDRFAAVRVNQRLEGWAVGLQLAALTLQSVTEQDTWLAFLQTQEYEFVSEYLYSEVLQQQPVTVQHFLLNSSILDRFCVELLVAILNSEDRAPLTKRQIKIIIDNLKRANLFVISLDEQNGWYRYHHLFQQLLRQTLGTQSGEQEIEALHRRASNWFAQQDYLEEALKHALAANDIDVAVTIVEENSRNFVNGLERRTLERWMESLPDEVIWQRPRLLVTMGWLLYRHWRMNALDAVSNRLADNLENKATDINPAEFSLMQGHLLIFRAATSFNLRNDLRNTLNYAEDALQLLPASEPGAQGIAIFYQTFALVGLAQKETATERLNQIIRNPSPSGPAKIQAFVALAMLSHLTNNLVQMDQVAQQFAAKPFQGQSVNGPANWFLGAVKFEKNLLDSAEEHIIIMIRQRHLMNFGGIFFAWLHLVRIKQIQGKYEEAQAQLDDLKIYTMRLNHAFFLRYLTALQALQWLHQGDRMAAYRWAHAFQPDERDDPLFGHDTPLLMWARIFIATGEKADKENVREFLQNNLTKLENTQFTRRKIQLLTHLASVFVALGDKVKASQHLYKALILAQPGGAIRSFADVGESLIPLLHQLQQDGIAPNHISEILAAFPGPPISTERSYMVEETAVAPGILTRREQEILLLMKNGYTNQEIADQLFVALSTVKRHASNIYIKLDVKNRMQAIVAAEQAGILSS